MSDEMFVLAGQLADASDALEAQYEYLEPHSPARGIAAVTLGLVDALGEALDEEQDLDAAVTEFLAAEARMRHNGHPADRARDAAGRIIRAAVDLGRLRGESPLTTAVSVARLLTGYCMLVPTEGGCS